MAAADNFDGCARIETGDNFGITQTDQRDGFGDSRFLEKNRRG
ncbi:MAG: hypothetical protein G01um101416_1167 [Microgenomates group bacterium Gr01-1014_16]|nr:MAG: hypothetical protein G01um101416_1167 [Microgenomates group bacterium Gr01-1014_16]